MLDTARLKVMCSKYGVDWPKLSAPQKTTFRHGAVKHGAQSAIGTVGTSMSDGVSTMDASDEYSQEAVRGSQGDAGLYEDYWRTEPLIYDAVQSHTEAVIAGAFELQMPEGLPDDEVEAMEGFVALHQAAFLNLACGFDRAIEDMMSMLIFGFAPMECVWTDKKTPKTYIMDMQFREQSTVHKWVYDAAMRQAQSCIFQTDGADGKKAEYTLKLQGAKASDVRLVVCNLSARGLNIEGVSPIRPAIHYIQLKRLLMTIAGLMAEKYGIPIIAVFEDASQLKEGEAGDDGELDDLQEVVDLIVALDAGVVKFPGAVRAQMLDIKGTMPDLTALIDYCDRMITTSFSVEGSLLGHQGSVGSYALGEVKERDAQASAPYYARQICQVFNGLIRRLCDEQVGPQVAYPKWIWRASVERDQTRWLADVQKLMGVTPVTQYPPKLKAAALEALDLPPDALDMAEAETTTGHGEGDDLQTQGAA